MIEIDVNEKILRVVRRHWFVLLGDFFVLLFTLAIPLVALGILSASDTSRFIAFAGNKTSAGAFFFFGWMLIVWVIVWPLWTDYYLDVLIVTDRRIFEIDQIGLFRRESSAFRIDRIQNVTVDVKGIIQTFLDFGTLRIETAGENEEFKASFIAHPYEVKKFINDCQDKAVERSQLVHIEPDADEPNKGRTDRSGV